MLKNSKINNTAPGKILVFGLPRTGTTVLQLQLSQLFELNNLSEVYTGDNIGIVKDIYSWTADQSQCIVKLLTTNLNAEINGVDFDRLISCGGFDLVVIPVGKNLTDTCISLYYAEQVVNQYHYYTNDQVAQQLFYMDLNFVTDIFNKEYQAFVDSLQYLDTHQIRYKTINYNDYVQNIQQEIDGVQFCIQSMRNLPMIYSNLDYTALCQNYQEVDNLINEITRTLC
ncbi:hypothetical protein UFOVP328_325 [uncultured Caudovirales phage]|uniref:Uncharacterized protein n=1 Tax=uncultured Caudovirales phage TaxID=2100421 RepID=A0A6J5LWC6_9CAUD|nr:hypothetical protein UFOVP328_325 [uncultured Caudovirales phage]